jgi:hypothetical protein
MPIVRRGRPRKNQRPGRPLKKPKDDEHIIGYYRITEIRDSRDRTGRIKLPFYEVFTVEQKNQGLANHESISGKRGVLIPITVNGRTFDDLKSGKFKFENIPEVENLTNTIIFQPMRKRAFGRNRQSKYRTKER